MTGVRRSPHARESAPGASHPARGLATVTGASYLALWALTAMGGLAADAGVRLITVQAPRDALAAEPATALVLLAHNAPVALWPLALVALDWPGIPLARRLGDALVAGQLLGHGLLIGSALGQQPGLWRYLPQLPLEWLALSIPAGAWVAARTSTPMSRSRGVAAALLTVATLTLAAILETYLVPIP
jgi:hypothetical protein